jgi:hypothetical protein
MRGRPRHGAQGPRRGLRRRSSTSGAGRGAWGCVTSSSASAESSCTTCTVGLHLRTRARRTKLPPVAHAADPLPTVPAQQPPFSRVVSGTARCTLCDRAFTAPVQRLLLHRGLYRPRAAWTCSWTRRGRPRRRTPSSRASAGTCWMRAGTRQRARLWRPCPAPRRRRSGGRRLPRPEHAGHAEGAAPPGRARGASSAAEETGGRRGGARSRCRRQLKREANRAKEGREGQGPPAPGRAGAPEGAGAAAAAAAAAATAGAAAAAAAAPAPPTPPSERGEDREREREREGDRASNCGALAG